MIEVVYTPKEKKGENDSIHLPKNIKQVGDIKSAKKIYIEDYAINYIREAHNEQTGSTIGVLLGLTQKSGSDRYAFIKGVILVEDAFCSESEIAISDSSWNDVYETMMKYYRDCQIIGWFISTSNINAATFRTLRKAHMNYFPGGDKVLYLYDYLEKSGFFYMFDNNQLVKQKGYIIYYERNEEMQNYMVDSRVKQYEQDTASEHEAAGQEKTAAASADLVSRKQGIINYCANAAMVVLILFIGMYVLDDKFDFTGALHKEQESVTLTNVVKVDGNVYPTAGELSFEGETEMELTLSDLKGTTEVVETSAEQLTQGTTMETSTFVETIKETSATQETPTEISKKEPATQAAVVYQEHVVKKGESLILICKKYYGNTDRLEEVMQLNKIDDVDKIYIGQVIKLP